MRSLAALTILLWVLALLLFVALSAYGAPAPWPRKEPPGDLPVRCVLRWGSSHYQAIFSRGGTYAGGFDGRVVWVGYWWLERTSSGWTLHLSETVQSRPQPSDYLHWTIYLDEGRRKGRLPGANGAVVELIEPEVIPTLPLRE